MDAYDDYNEGTLSAEDILTSYCCPMRDEKGNFIGSITVSCRQKDTDAIISVSNTGASIPIEAREHIFVPFTKLDSFTEGVGLGLSLSRHIARQLGGDITYDNTYEEGTRFIVKMPINLS